MMAASRQDGWKRSAYVALARDASYDESFRVWSVVFFWFHIAILVVASALSRVCAWGFEAVCVVVVVVCVIMTRRGRGLMLSFHRGLLPFRMETWLTSVTLCL